MGHIQYYLQYAKQPSIFSILSSLHTQTLAKNQPPPGSSINALMDIALQKVSFLPACLVTDKWRWDVFSGAVTQNTWNSHWWKYRKKYQKLKPPVPSSEATDFDPGAQFHVTSGVEYIFLYMYIVQFQFYRSLCIAAGEYNPDNKKVPLHKCESTAAGEKLRSTW
jgi:peptidyl-dipeptidase A